MEKYGSAKLDAQKYGLSDFPEVNIAVSAADEAISICRKELAAHNPQAAKTAADMAARAVSQMEMVVQRARERHEWELPQRRECEDALDEVEQSVQVRATRVADLFRQPTPSHSTGASAARTSSMKLLLRTVSHTMSSRSLTTLSMIFCEAWLITLTMPARQL